VRLVLLIVCVPLAAAPATARAQLCAGYAPLGRAPFQIAGNATIYFEAMEYGVRLTYGARGPFLSAGVGHTVLDFVSDASWDLKMAAGWELALNRRRTFQVCPFAAVTRIVGPVGGPLDMGNTPNYDETDWQWGVGAGLLVRGPQEVEIAPTVSIAILRGEATSTRISLVNSATATFGMLTLGLGVMFSRVVTVLPSVSLPIHQGVATPTYTLGIGLNFGHRISAGP